MAEGQEKREKGTERNGHSLFKHLFGDLESGWATLWMKREDGSKETVWFDLGKKDSLRRMADTAVLEDAAGSEVYFSTCPGRAARGPVERVKAADVAFVPAFFMDIDTRRGSKAVADVPESVEAAMAGLKCLPFPPSAAVCSGNGVHAYWRLEEPAKAGSPEALASLARQMKGFALTVAKTMGYDDLDVSAS